MFRPEAPLAPLFILSLIRGLPEGSRFIAEKRGGPQFRGWDTDRYIAVANVNAVRALQYTYIAAHSKNRPKPPEPFPVPDMPERQKNTGPGSFAFIAAHKLAAAKRKKGEVSV